MLQAAKQSRMMKTNLNTPIAKTQYLGQRGPSVVGCYPSAPALHGHSHIATERHAKDLVITQFTHCVILQFCLQFSNFAFGVFALYVHTEGKITLRLKINANRRSKNDTVHLPELCSDR